MTRVLLPVAVLEGESVSAGLIDLFGTVDVTLLGYHELPEQTPPDQARQQYEDRATDALTDLVAEFREAGGDADHRLVFTHDREKTIRRATRETGSAAYAIGGVTGPVDKLLVPLTGDVASERIAEFVETLVGDREIGVTLFLASEDEDAAALDLTAERLRDAGIDVGTRAADGKAFDALIDAVPGHDAVVMGEQAPSLRSLVFGDEAERVAEASVGPVLVVRTLDRDADGAEAEEEEGNDEKEAEEDDENANEAMADEVEEADGAE